MNNRYIVYVGEFLFAITDNTADAYELYEEAKSHADEEGLEAILVWDSNSEVVEYYDPCF